MDADYVARDSALETQLTAIREADWVLEATKVKKDQLGEIATHLESEREIVGRFKTMKLDKYLGPDALIAAFEQSQKEQYALEEKQAQARLEAAEDATAAANLAAVEARLGQ